MRYNYYVRVHMYMFAHTFLCVDVHALSLCVPPTPFRESKKECEDVRGQVEAVRRDLQHERRRTALRTRRSTMDRSTNTASTTSTASTSTTSAASTNIVSTSSQRAALSVTSDRETQTELVLGLIGGSEQDGRPQTTHTSTQTIGEPKLPLHTPLSRPSNGGRTSASPPTEGDSQVVEGGVSSGRRGEVDRGRRPKPSQCMCSQHKCVEDSLKLVRAVTEVKALKAKCKDLERQVLRCIGTPTHTYSTCVCMYICCVGT